MPPRHRFIDVPPLQRPVRQVAPIEPDEPSPWEVPEAPPNDLSALKRYLAMGARGIGGLAGVTPITGAIGGGLGETAAELIEGQGFKPWQIAGETAVGAAGGGIAKNLIKYAGRPALAALSGALLGGAAPVLRSGIEEGELPSASDVAIGAATGGAVSGGLAHLFGRLNKPAATVGQEFVVEPTAQAGGQVLTGTKRPGIVPTEGPRTIRGTGTPIETAMGPFPEPKASIPYGGPAAEASTRVAKIVAKERATAVNAAKDAAAAREIEAAREGMEPQVPRVSESISAPIPGGRERMTTQYKPPAEGVIPEIPPGTAPVAPRSPDLVPGQPPAPESVNPFVAAAVAASERGAPKASPLSAALVPEVVERGAPEASSSLGTFLTPKAAIPEVLPTATPSSIARAKAAAEAERRLAEQAVPGIHITPEGNQVSDFIDVPPTTPAPELPFNPPRLLESAPTPAGFEQPGLGPMFQTAEGSTISQGPLPEMTDAEFLAAVTKPAERAAARSAAETPELAQLFRSPVDAVGAAYRAAKTTPGINPLATRQLGIGLQQEAGAAGLPTQRTANLGKFLSEKVSPEIGPISTPSVRTVPSAKAIPRPKGKQYGTETVTPAEKLEGLSGARPMTPEEVAEQLSFIDRLKKSGKTEKGAIAPELAARLGLSAAGAVTGAAIGGATDPLDNPWASATAGGLAGGAAGFALPAIVSRLSQMGVHPDTAKGVGEVAEQLKSPEGVKTLGEKVTSFIPQYLRGNYLLSTNLLNNAIAGPVGSGYMNALAYSMAGDPRGAKFIQDFNWSQFPLEYWNAIPRAKELIGHAERAGGAGFAGAKSQYEQFAAIPGMSMTAGDMVIREKLVAAGFPDELARKMTATNEPVWRLSKSLVNVSRSGAAGQVMLPFARTILNLAERAPEWTPGLGFLAKHEDVANPVKLQAIRQALGLGAFGAAEQAGENVDPQSTNLRMLRGAATNLAGPASLLAAAGFAAGQARQQGKPAGKAAVREALSGLPLPTTEPFMNLYNYAASENPEERLPRGITPTVFREIQDLLNPPRPARRRGTRK